MRTGVCLVACCLVIGACGTDGGTSSQVCEALVSCDVVSKSECEASFDLLALSPACEDALIAATCADHASKQPTYQELCFPSCSWTGAKCNDNDQLVQCEKGYSLTFACEDLCRAKGKTYVGSCGSTYMGNTTTDGSEVCWCG